MENMETVVGVAIGVLAAVFIGSLLALIVVCRQKYCRRVGHLSRQCADSRPDVSLISGPDLELDDVVLHPEIERILDDSRWVDDATGLVPHCLAILKMCHTLTERLVTMAMGAIMSDNVTEIVQVARNISPRVDDVVRCMYPPLDPRLLEAYCTALVLSVTNLALVTKSLCQGGRRRMAWVNGSLDEMNEHLQVLREAAEAQEHSSWNAHIDGSHQTTVVPSQTV